MDVRHNSDEKELGRKRRGAISERDPLDYLDLTDNQIIVLLSSEDVRERAIAATLIGKRQCYAALNQLCAELKREEALYVRLAIAEALTQLGKPAVEVLCNLLGEIGSNHEFKLPEVCCRKRSYPLVRDFAGRTLVKIGVSAVPALLEVLHKGTDRQIEQAVDALGAIAYKTGDLSSLGSVLQLLENKQDNIFLVWKITRSLGGYRSEDVSKKLIEVMHQYTQPAIRWEAIRSMGQIDIGKEFVFVELDNAKNDPDPRVRDTAINVIKRLRTR